MWEKLKSLYYRLMTNDDDYIRIETVSLYGDVRICSGRKDNGKYGLVFITNPKLFIMAGVTRLAPSDSAARLIFSEEASLDTVLHELNDLKKRAYQKKEEKRDETLS